MDITLADPAMQLAGSKTQSTTASRANSSGFGWHVITAMHAFVLSLAYCADRQVYVRYVAAASGLTPRPPAT